VNGGNAKGHPLVVTGAFVWSAPEVLMGAKCSNKVDIYSFGVILWELVTGESPQRGRMRSIRWGAVLIMSTARIQIHGRPDPCQLLQLSPADIATLPRHALHCYGRVLEECPPGIADLVTVCMERDASIRPSAAGK
jgi:serine/threonine protein kinase